MESGGDGQGWDSVGSFGIRRVCCDFGWLHLQPHVPSMSSYTRLNNPHSDSVELRGIVPVRRTVTTAKASDVKARDLQRYSSRTDSSIRFAFDFSIPPRISKAHLLAFAPRQIAR